MQPEHANPNDEPIQPLALQAAEKRLELCLASAGLGIWTYNIATDEFWANERAKHLHGHEPHEVHTLKAAGTNIYPEDRDRAQAILTEAIQTGAQLQLEYRVVWRDSSIHWLAAQAEFVPSGQPGEGMFYGTVQDISDRLRVEGDRNRHAADLAFLAEISQDLARLTNIAETVNAIAAKIGAYFNASLCTFSMVSEGAETITTAYAWHRADVPSPIGKQRLRDYHTEDFWQACRAGKTYVVCDVANDPRVNAAPVAALKIGAFVNVPQVRENEWEFSLFIADTELRVWREDEIELMQELTTRIWVRLDRAHTEAALHVSEEKYRTLFNSMDEAYAVVEGSPIRRADGATSAS